ncbi:MAG: hypothetical protein HRU14_05095 [Planctomycetes bacterium]|nr:hypothetical protein [Planctomycetota bacterium]
MLANQERRSPVWAAMLPVFALISLTVVVVLMVSGVPGGPTATPSPGVQPVPMPLSMSTITTNNARIGGTFRLTVHTRPQVGVWVLASSNNPWTTIGPWQVNLAPDWYLIQDFAWTSGGDRIELQISLPYVQAWVGTEALVNALVHDPNSMEWFWTGSVLHRFSDAPGGGRSICLIRQVSVTGEAPWAPLQADALANALSGVGHSVSVVDDVLPTDLASFDLILDCRFTLPPNSDEQDRLTDFLQHYGGVFLLSGPAVGSTWGQWRFAFIQQWANNRLGLGLTFGTSINQSSGVTGEQVSLNAEPRYLTQPSSVAGMPYRVHDEGGTFGPEGFQPRGWPWIVAPAGVAQAPTVYGMLFKPDDIPALPVKGSLAILFNGADDALAPSGQNPSAHLIFMNLASWLDV